MSVWGKLLGAAAGMALGGPLGAVLGGVAGHVYDRWRGERTALPPPVGGAEPGLPPVWGDPIEMRRIAFATAVVVLAAKLAKADGVVSRLEIDAFKRIFDIADEEVGSVGRLFDEAKRDARGFEPYALQVAQTFAFAPAPLSEFLEALFAVAAADGDLHAAELGYLRRVAGVFRLDDAAFEAVRARFDSARRAPEMPAGSDYRILGVRPSIGDDELKLAYRKLVREHHPDALVASGMPEEFVQRAGRTLAVINAAYDRIAKQRGLR